MFSVFAKLLSKLITICPVAESRLPVGSSAKINFGLFASALAIATRCCSPPDSLVGLRKNLSSVMPACLSSLAACARRLGRGELHCKLRMIVALILPSLFESPTTMTSLLALRLLALSILPLITTEVSEAILTV